MDYSTGTMASPIATGISTGSGTAIWTLDGTSLVIGNTGASVFGSVVPPTLATIDIVTDALINALQLPSADFPLSALISTTSGSGAALYAQTGTGLQELDPMTYANRQTLNAPGSVALSSGEGEILALDSGALRRVDLTNNTVSVVSSGLASRSAISTVAGRAYFIEGFNVLELNTDPAVPPTPIASLTQRSLFDTFVIAID